MRTCIIKFQEKWRCACKRANYLDEHGRQNNMVNTGCVHACSEHGTDNPVSTSRPSLKLPRLESRSIIFDDPIEDSTICDVCGTCNMF